MLEVKPYSGGTTFLVESETRQCSRPECGFKRKFKPEHADLPCYHCGSPMEKRFMLVDVLDSKCGCECWTNLNARKVPGEKPLCKHLIAARSAFADEMIRRIKAQENKGVEAF